MSGSIYSDRYIDMSVLAAPLGDCCCPWGIIEMKNKITAAEWSLSLGLASFCDGLFYSREEEIAQLRTDLDNLCLSWIRAE